MTSTSSTPTAGPGFRKRAIAGLAIAAIAAGGLVTASTATTAEAAVVNCSAPKITGKLWQDDDGDNIADTGEEPVAGITMRVYKHTLKPDHSAKKVGEFTTAADGTYSTGTLTPGYHSIEILGKLPSGYTAPRTTKSTTVVAGKCVTGMDFALDYKTTVSEATDVLPGHTQFTEMQWAIDKKLFPMPDQKFYPSVDVLRGEGAVFIHGAMGYPGEAPVYTPFTDIDSDDDRFAAIAWMVDKGLVSGHADYTFGVDRKMTRGELAVILYRLKAPAGYKAPTTAPFSDINDSSAFYTPTAWMKSAGITSGYTNGTYRQDESLSRKELAAFMYRFNKKFGE